MCKILVIVFPFFGGGGVYSLSRLDHFCISLCCYYELGISEHDTNNFRFIALIGARQFNFLLHIYIMGGDRGRVERVEKEILSIIMLTLAVGLDWGLGLGGAIP